MAIQIQVRRDTTTNWETENPILAQGELGLDLTLNKIKFGDGSNYWTGLTYATADVSMFYTKTESDANFLSANTSYYTEAQADGNFLSATTTEQYDFSIEFDTGTTYSLVPYSHYGFSVESLWLESDNTSATITVSGSTAIVGLISITGGTAGHLYTATSANVLSVADSLTLEVTESTDSTIVRGSFKLIRT